MRNFGIVILWLALVPALRAGTTYNVADDFSATTVEYEWSLELRLLNNSREPVHSLHRARRLSRPGRKPYRS